jgi:ribosome-associated translation inhibitor RaiA
MTSVSERRLQVRIDVHQHYLSLTEEWLLHESLDGLARQVDDLPLADLHVLVEGNARSNDVSVKLTLRLPGATLVTSDHDVLPQVAFERSLDRLIDCVRARKRRLAQVSERRQAAKGAYQELHPRAPIDEALVLSAVEAGDYVEFRTALAPFEVGLRRRVGRLLRRYPDLEAQIGESLEIADLVEEVLLQAFDQYETRPAEVPLGAWLESLIDPAVKALEEQRDDELENISLVRTARLVEHAWDSPGRRDL